VALLVDLDRRMARRARRLLVGGKQRILEGGDECAALDAFLALDVPDCLDDLLSHLAPTSSIRFPRTIESYGMSTDSPSVLTVTLRSPAETTSPRTRLRSCVRSVTCRPIASRKCACLRNGRSIPGE